MNYIKIGNVKIKRTAALAPMASVADRAYRMLCREYGACYTVSELISAKGLCYNDRKHQSFAQLPIMNARWHCSFLEASRNL